MDHILQIFLYFGTLLQRYIHLICLSSMKNTNFTEHIKQYIDLSFINVHYGL